MESHSSPLASLLSRAPIGRLLLSVLCVWAFVGAGLSEASAGSLSAGSEHASESTVHAFRTDGAVVVADAADSSSRIDVVDPQEEEEEEENEQASRGGLRGARGLQPRGCLRFVGQGPRRREPRSDTLGIDVRGPPATHTR